MYRVTLNWDIEEINVPEVEVIDAEIISDVSTGGELDISDITYCDALAQHFMETEGPRR